MFAKLSKRIIKPFLTLKSRNVSTYQLPVVDVRGLSPDFQKQAFAALQKKGALILNNFPQEFVSSTAQLFSAYDDFLKQPNGVKQKFANTEPTDYKGFYPYGNFLLGSKLCDRYFLSRDPNGELTHSLPKPYYGHSSMLAAANQVYQTTHFIFQKILLSIEDGFGLKYKEFQHLFLNHHLVTVVDRYLPITQEKLHSWMENEKLVLTNDNRVEAFIPHKDLAALTILMYRHNDCYGLEINTTPGQATKNFAPIGLKDSNSHDIRAIVITGKVMEVLTDNLLQAAEHRVVVDPQQKNVPFSRYALNTFLILNSDKHGEIKPLVVSPTGPHYAPQATESYFSHESTRYTETEKNRAVKRINPEVLNQYPREKEVKTVETERGNFFVRY